ncbi:MAG TPA: EutN/CcmL family microcompartment protein [Bryobacteraceae bacterium]|jgi:ethanolamine utilization protein EutN|nr:EutN/CcmL family microcompartment protein [Bryobacteraceae bacterium]
MYLARIDGTLTSTVKHETLEGFRLLIAQRLEGDGSDSGEPQVIADMVGARIGSIVLVTTDNESVRKASANTNPMRLAVMGIVDSVYPELGSAPEKAA